MCRNLTHTLLIKAARHKEHMLYGSTSINLKTLTLKTQTNKPKTRIKPQYDPAIPLLGIYPEETKIGKDTCVPLFIIALFTIARTWKQPRCPSTDEWIKKLWYKYTREYYSAIKTNTFESVLMK